MPSDHNLVLTGFMGTGKTSVGRQLARILQMDFVDTDEVIESQHGPITQLFADRGEAEFRSIEASVARHIGQRRGQVIATGGRTILYPDNFRELGRHSRIFCLVATADEIHQRVTADTARRDRPLLLNQDPKQRIVELLAERTDLYARFPRVATDGRAPTEIATEISGLWTAESTFEISTPSGPCRYTIGAGVLPKARELVSHHDLIVLITEDTVESRYGPHLGDVDFAINLPADSIPASREAIEPILEQLSGAKVDTSAAVISLGGVAVAKSASLVAAGLGQEVDLIMCPSGYMAMVDYMIDDKSHRSPDGVVADVGLLQNLSDNDLLSELSSLEDRGLVADGSSRARITNSAPESVLRAPPSLAGLMSLATEAVRTRFGVADEN